MDIRIPDSSRPPPRSATELTERACPSKEPIDASGASMSHILIEQSLLPEARSIEVRDSFQQPQSNASAFTEPVCPASMLSKEQAPATAASFQMFILTKNPFYKSWRQLNQARASSAEAPYTNVRCSADAAVPCRHPPPAHGDDCENCAILAPDSGLGFPQQLARNGLPDP